MGSAYSTIAADVTARFQRLKAGSVVFITGTDEHGEKIAAAAALKAVSPQQHCDTVASEFKQLWDQVTGGCCDLAVTLSMKTQQTLS